KATAGVEGGRTREGQGRLGRQGPENDGVTPDGRRSPIGGVRPGSSRSCDMSIRRPAVVMSAVGPSAKQPTATGLRTAAAAPRHPLGRDIYHAATPPANVQRAKPHTVGRTQSGARIKSIVGE